MIQEKSLMKAIEQVRGGKTGTSPLYSLRLQNCGHSMSNKSAQTLTALASSLNHLELSGCYKLGDEALETLLAGCTQL